MSSEIISYALLAKTFSTSPSGYSLYIMRCE